MSLKCDMLLSPWYLLILKGHNCSTYFDANCEFANDFRIYMHDLIDSHLSILVPSSLSLIYRLLSFAIAAVVEALRSSQTPSNDVVKEIGVKAIGYLALDNANATILGDCGACEGNYRLPCLGGNRAILHYIFISTCSVCFLAGVSGSLFGRYSRMFH